MNPTQALDESGQSIWLDDITRPLGNEGTLARYIAEYSVTGLTSNPGGAHSPGSRACVPAGWPWRLGIRPPVPQPPGAADRRPAEQTKDSSATRHDTRT
jgi:hypothetical protein